MTTLFDNIFGTFIGMEFREDSVVVTCLKNNISGMQLISSSGFPMKENDETVVAEINEFISKHAGKVDRVFVAVPDSWALVKFIKVPAMKGRSKGTLDNLMRFETERHIPFEIDDVATDFLIMDEASGVYSAVIVAVRNEKVDFVRDFLDKISLQPQSITISSFAVLSTVEMDGISVGGWQEILGIVRKSDTLGQKGESTVLLYIEKRRSTLTVLVNGLCVRLKSFQIDTEQSEDALAGKISGYLDEVQAQHSISRFDRIMVRSDISINEEYEARLIGKISEKTPAAGNVMSVKGSLGGAGTRGLEPSIGAAFAGLGVGSYGVNLLPHKREYAVNKIAPLTTRIFFVLILILVIGIFTTDAVKQKRLLTHIQQEIDSNEPEVRAVEELSEDMGLLKQKRDFLYYVEESEITLELLAELTRIMPRSSWITNMNYKAARVKGVQKSGGELVISGYADSSSALISLLEDSPYLEKVEFVGTIKKTRGKEQFKLSAQVDPFPRREAE